ncbi:MAG: tetratricopeptide repeat protein [Bacteroidota bacterium]
MKCIINFFILLLAIPLFSQNTNLVDSLEIALEFEHSAIGKVALLEKLTNELKYSDVDRALEYAQQAYQISTEVDDDISTIISNLLLAEISWMQTDYKSAMERATAAMELSETQAEAFFLARSYLFMGVIYSSIDNYDEGAEYYFMSLKIFQELDDRKFIGIVLNNIGDIFSKQKKYDKAAEYFMEALNIAREVNDSLGVKVGLTNYAAALSNMGKYKEAKKMMEKAIIIGKEDEINPWYGANIVNLAIVYQELEEYDTAFILLNRAVDIFSQLEDEYYVAHTLYHLAYFYFETEDYASSIAMATQSLSKARKYSFQTLILNNADLLRKNYIKLNRKDEAYKYCMLQYQVKDSLYAEENLTKLTNLELQYEFDKKQQEKLINQQRKDFLVIIIIISLILVIIIVMFILTRQRIKAQNTLLAKEKLEAELDAINKEFTTNAMYLVKKNELLTEISEKLIEIESEAVKDETKDAIRRIANELQKSKDNDVWQDFELRFNQVHNDFYENLLRRFPALTPNDLRLCALLRLNMSSKEISEITTQRLGTIEMARLRIRKKLGISGTDVNLVTFLSQI